jgi:3-hydroxyisobutyrate dehydrogenase-like beta-hydroxyacid dehydrogenase
MKIGWVGLGAIGAEMAGRLLAAGHAVTVYPRGKGLGQARAAGAQVCDDYAALAAGSELVGICVYNDAQVREVLFGGGALAALKPGAVLANHTTGSPALAREIAERAPAGVGVLDATFSGGPHDVAAGRLTVMAGGAAEALERARPALEAYAAQIHHLGGPGLGQTLKLLNNLLFATNQMNAARMLQLAEAQGFDAAAVARVLQGCSGASFALGLFQRPAPVAAVLAGSRPYLEKDVAAVAAAASDAGLDLGAFAETLAFFAPASR